METKSAEHPAENNLPTFSRKKIDRALVKCCSEGDLEGARSALDRGADINCRIWPNGSSPLVSALIGWDAVVEYLLEQPEIDLELPGKDDTTPLIQAAIHGNLPLLERLLDARVDTSGENDFGTSALAMVIAHFKDNLPLVKRVLSGFSPEMPDKEMSDKLIGPLWEACGRSGSPEIVTLLLDSGANYAARTATKLTVLHTSVSCGNGDVAGILIDKGVNVNATDEDGVTPLHTAADCDQCDLIFLLLERGADINAMTTDLERTPLMSAACAGNDEACKVLIECGADVSFRNPAGGDAFLETATNGTIVTAKLLVEAGADMHVRDAHGRNAADMACDQRKYSHLGNLRNLDEVLAQCDDYLKWLAEHGVTPTVDL